MERTLNHESLASDQAETGLRSENEQPRLRLVHPDAYRMSFPMKITLWWPLRPTPRGVPRPRQAIFGAVSAPITMISQGYAPPEARILAWAAPSRLRRLCVAPFGPLGLGLTTGGAQAVEAPLLIWTACPKAGSDQFLDPWGSETPLFDALSHHCSPFFTICSPPFILLFHGFSCFAHHPKALSL